MVRSFLFVALVALALSLTGLGSTTRRASASGGPVTPQHDGTVPQPDLCFGFAGALGGYNGAASFPCNSACVMFPSIYTPKYDQPVCPGPPALITAQPFPTAVSCASSSNIEVAVYDAGGLYVADDTQISFTTDLGTITSNVTIMAGRATASLTIPTKTTGVAHISMSSGAATGQKTVTVTC